MIRIVLADDQRMIAGALAGLLSLESDLSVVAIASDGAEAFELAQKHLPDVVVSDIEMPKLSGIELAEKIKLWNRERETPTRVVIVTAFARPGFLRRALEAEVRGYLLKDAPSEKLAEAIRVVARGGRSIDPALAQEAWSDDDPLTDRERQILRLAGIGKTSEEIATSLHLSSGTVRNYLSNAIEKLMVDNRIEAYQRAKDKGWL